MRQGNTNEEVSIYRYVTQGSFDAYLWQALETKARFIAQILTGDSTVRQAEDIGAQELSYAEVKAIASGNPAVLTLAEADAALHRLHILQKHHADEQYLARRQLRALPAEITRLERRLAALTAGHRHRRGPRHRAGHHRHAAVQPARRPGGPGRPPARAAGPRV